MKKSIALAALFAATMCFALPANAQKKKKGKKGKKTEEAPPAEALKDATKNCVSFDGLFKMHQDTVTGKTFIEIKKNQLNKDFIYFSQVEDGVLEAGFFRGSYRGSKVINFKRHFEKIEVVAENTAFYYDENNAISKAKNANINTPIIASEKIEAENDSIMLISGDALFLSEKFQMVKPPSFPGFPSLLGGLSKSKSKVLKFHNYPKNTDISVMYVYDNPSPSRGASRAVTDVRSINVSYRHSIMEMPDDNFKPRQDDARVGFFMTQVTDMTSFDATPYRDMIHRWRLEKKDPSAALSEPVKPITWWIENTTPEEFRPIIKEGVERWNIAFEKAGFKNAVVVKVQPDDAEWDAGDIRYNVLRWTSSPLPPFGGYGPSFVNPRTGEILGADIMLEFVSISNRLRREELFSKAALPFNTDNLEEVNVEDYEMSKEEMIAQMHLCDVSSGMHNNMMFGVHAMRAMNMSDASEKEFVKQTLSRLVLHEVGHTLGMMHNMRASTMLSPEEIKDAKRVAEVGLSNSVMEYPAINFARNKEDQTLYYDITPGPYDKWIIEYGYSVADSDPAREASRLEGILSRSADPLLAFGNDADDMRAPGKGMNPDVNIYDLSNDPVAYAAERCEFVRDLLPQITERYIVEGKNYHELRQAYLILTGEQAVQTGIMTRQIGGVRYDRSMNGDNKGVQPLDPISEKDQRAAMSALKEYVFSPDAFKAPSDIYTHMLPQRRGFNHFVATDDPKLQERYLGIQGNCLAHLLHPNTTARILNSANYGNTYTLDKVMTDLTDAIFKADLRTKVNTTRQNLQVLYIKRLANIVKPKSKYRYSAQSMAWYELKRIKKLMASAAGPNIQTKAHRSYIVQLIEQTEDQPLMSK